MNRGEIGNSLDRRSVLGWSYPNHVDRNIISEMRAAHGEDRQHATTVGCGIDGIDFS